VRLEPPDRGAAQTVTEALGVAETSSELAVDGLAETAETALRRLRLVAEDESAPRPMRRRAHRALEWLANESGR
jgi:hypothetical protein